MVNRKSRCDFFYFTAKKYKFRSRAAFKLIELNRKFSFFNQAHDILDLCAAPGSWMQVSRELAPYSATILGVDIYPIKKIKGCQSMRGDITSSMCINSMYKTIQKERKKINIVLHDGSPKMGTQWISDVYKQNNLVLSAFKVVNKLLYSKGWFITKIFKSEHFNNLFFMMKYFFKKIFIFKPIASRSNSTETYFICKQYFCNMKKHNYFIHPDFIFKKCNEFFIQADMQRNVEFINIEKKMQMLITLIKNKKLFLIAQIIRFENNDESNCLFGTGFFTATFFKLTKKNLLYRNIMYIIINWIEKNFEIYGNSG